MEDAEPLATQASCQEAAGRSEVVADEDGGAFVGGGRGPGGICRFEVDRRVVASLFSGEDDVEARPDTDRAVDPDDAAEIVCETSNRREPKAVALVWSFSS